MLKQINPKEKELRNLIEELKALRILIRATEGQVQEFDNTNQEIKEIEKEKKLFKQIESLEKVVEKVSEEKIKGSTNPNENTAKQYANVSAQNIATAANKETINELYALAEKDIWTKEDSSKFFTMQYAIQKTNNYKENINDIFKKTVEQNYNVLKKVEKQQSKQIKNNYNPLANQFQQQTAKTTETTNQNISQQNNTQIKTKLENKFKPDYKI